MNLFWMSFCDSARPAGEQFLGALLMEGTDVREVVARSHALKINPGGEIMIAEFELPPGEKPIFPLDTLLSRADIDRIDKAMPFGDFEED